MSKVIDTLTIVQQRSYHFLTKPHYSVKLKIKKMLKVCIVLYNSVVTTFLTLRTHKKLSTAHTSPTQNLLNHTKRTKQKDRSNKQLC